MKPTACRLPRSGTGADGADDQDGRTVSPYLWRTGTAAISWPCIRAGGGAAGAIPGLPWRSSASITACPARELSAVRGPSLGPGRAEFTRFGEEWGEEFTAFFDARTMCMDLWRLTREQLRRAGIPDERIYGIDLCTRSLADDFFSYRADRNCGRQASLIWLEGTGTDQTINI